MKNGFKILGFTDSEHSCDRCGRQELRGVWKIETDGGELFNLGSGCVTKAFQMTTKEFNAKVSDFEKSQLEAARAEWQASESFAFLMAYIGSAEHEADLSAAPSRMEGFRAVQAKTAPARSEKEAIAKKYGVPAHKLD